MCVHERRLHTGAGPIGAHGARRLRRRQSDTSAHGSGNRAGRRGVDYDINKSVLSAVNIFSFLSDSVFSRSTNKMLNCTGAVPSH